MVWNDPPRIERELWEEAIRSGLGLVSAYLTPESYGLASLHLAAAPPQPGESFATEIRARIELAKAGQIVGSISAAEASLGHAYRHTVHYGRGRIEGALIVPRLVQERAANRFLDVPVLRIQRQIETPEALLVSEAIRSAANVCRCWRGRGGAEAMLAKNWLIDLNRIEARAPWSELRDRPRSSIRALAAIVKHRAIAGWNRKDGPISKFADLILEDASSVAAAAGPIAFLASTDERFEDRLFELVCLGWLIAAFAKSLDGFSIDKAGLTSGNRPILSGSFRDLKLRLFYQSGHLSNLSTYRWKITQRPLRAIPDFVIEVDQGDTNRVYVIDAKNRGRSAESEIVYKLLGYKENLKLEPYWALGLAPGGRKRRINSVYRNNTRIHVAFVALDRGAQDVGRGVASMLRL
jgi:hypothetical protein